MTLSICDIRTFEINYLLFISDNCCYKLIIVSLSNCNQQWSTLEYFSPILLFSFRYRTKHKYKMNFTQVLYMNIYKKKTLYLDWKSSVKSEIVCIINFLTSNRSTSWLFSRFYCFYDKISTEKPEFMQ